MESHSVTTGKQRKQSLRSESVTVFGRFSATGQWDWLHVIAHGSNHRRCPLPNNKRTEKTEQ